jgi:adenine-specific DNA-methyltransferase
MKTLNYIGCKKSLCPTLLNLIQSSIPNLHERSFFDLFAGTGIVSYTLNPYVFSVSANDLEYYSFVILSAILKSTYTPNIQNIISSLNSLTPVPGLVYTYYSENAGRLFFTNDNSQKIDAIRIELNRLIDSNEISINEYYFLLASLLVSADKVANTSCVYGAFLKKFKSSSIKPMILEPIHVNTISGKHNKIFNTLAEELVSQYSFDIVYMDPPYNQRQYSANYSPLNYIALYDESIQLTGKTGLIHNYNKSTFSKKQTVKNSFASLISTISANDIFISYNNEGLLTEQELKDIFLKKGDVILYKILYKKFKNNNNSQLNKKVWEYFWHIRVHDNLNTVFSEFEIEMEKYKKY